MNYLYRFRISVYPPLLRTVSLLSVLRHCQILLVGLYVYCNPYTESYRGLLNLLCLYVFVWGLVNQQTMYMPSLVAARLSQNDIYTALQVSRTFHLLFFSSVYVGFCTLCHCSLCILDDFLLPRLLLYTSLFYGIAFFINDEYCNLYC